MPSYQQRNSQCGEAILRPSYLHDRNSYTCKTTSLYWIRTQQSFTLPVSVFLTWLRTYVVSLFRPCRHRANKHTAKNTTATWPEIRSTATSWTRWAYDVRITSLLRRNDIAMSFWRNNDVDITFWRNNDVIITLCGRSHQGSLHIRSITQQNANSLDTGCTSLGPF